MKYVLKFSASLLAISVLVSCASSGVVKNTTPIMTGIPVALDFVYVESSSALSDVETERLLLNELIITGLNERHIFGTVSGNKDVSSGPGLTVKVEIKEIKRVSDDARVWAGALAGRASILIQVTVADSTSGKRIEAFEAEGKSGKSSDAGTTNEAIKRAAEQVVVEMVKISMQTSPGP